MRDIEPLVTTVMDVAFEIHRGLGPGLLESVYEGIFADALATRGLSVERQKQVAFVYAGRRYAEGLTLDLLVEGRLVLELKSVERLAPLHYKQLLTYLRALDLPLGLLINFGGARMADGFRRVVNNYVPVAPSRRSAR